MTPITTPLRLGVLISGAGSTLANLAARIRAGQLRGVEIACVVSSRAAVRGVEIARDFGLPCAILRKRDFAGPVEHSAAISAALERAAVGLVVLGGYLCPYLPSARFRTRTLNIHPALLPRYGGMGMYGHRVHAAVLAAGERISGCTVHLVDEHYDHGPIVAQARVPVEPDDTPDTLAERVLAAERELYPRVIQRVADHGVPWLDPFWCGQRPLALEELA